VRATLDLVFDVKAAFQALKRTPFAPRELRETLDEMRRANFHLIPVSVETADFFRVGVEQRWIRRREDGRYVIRVPA